MTTFKGFEEVTPCNGEINYTVNKHANTITCKFATLTQGTICTSCPWSKLCSHLTTSPSRTILVKAFTGMPIAELPIQKETTTHLEVLTHQNTLLKFDKQTGLQINAKNPKYANRIEAC